MKKQISSTIKAHLLRGAFVFFPLVLAVCVIPFALGQRNHRDISKRTLNFPRPLLIQQQTLEKQPATLSDTILNHHQSQAAKQAQLPSGPPIQGAPGVVNCDSEPGIIIHDDGVIDDGFSGNPAVVSLVIFADKFTPAVYPATFTAVCLDFVTLAGGPPSYNIDVVVFDDDGPGGSPGTELGSLLNQTATTHVFSPGQQPVWNSYDISSLGLVIDSGSVYIGARWVPPSPVNVYMSSDENGAGFGGGYWFNNFDNTWDVIQNAFPLYRSMMIRAVGAQPGLAVSSTDPAVGSVIFTQPTDFIVNVTEPVQPATLQASDFTVNGIPANSVNYSGGTTTMTFHYNSTPVTMQGVQTMHIDDGAFLSDPDGDPVHAFTGTFRYDALLLQVTSTDPPVGGTFTLPGPFTYDVNFNEPVDPASVQTSDLTLSGIAGATVTGVSVINGNMTAEFTLDVNRTGTLTANIAAGAVTDQFGNPGAAFSGNYQVEGCTDQYGITSGTDTIVPGTTDTGNHCDDCNTVVSLPFSFTLYGQTYNSVNVSSNGRLDFIVPNEPGGFITSCLPAPPNIGPVRLHDLRSVA